MTEQNAPKLVTDRDEILRRQVVKPWTKPDGSPMSVAFSPTPKDKKKLSTDRERATPQRSYERYTESCGQPPEATWGIRVGAILDAHLQLPDVYRDGSHLQVLDDAREDGNHDDHASILFQDIDVSKNQQKKVHERLASELKKDAVNRGKLYPSAG